MYKQCVAAVESMCPVGVRVIFAVSTEWDKNIQLATYTCDTALDGLCLFLAENIVVIIVIPTNTC